MVGSAIRLAYRCEAKIVSRCLGFSGYGLRFGQVEDIHDSYFRPTTLVFASIILEIPRKPRVIYD